MSFYNDSFWSENVHKELVILSKNLLEADACKIVGLKLFYRLPGCWLIWGLMSHQLLRSYRDRTLIYSILQQTEEGCDSNCNPWFMRQVI